MIGKWWAKRKAKKKLKKERKIILSSCNIDVSSINTLVCLAGPYRNLTTLTASIAALHPNCQVLNHAQKRILPHQEVDFFSDYTLDKWKRFLFLIKQQKRLKFVLPIRNVLDCAVSNKKTTLAYIFNDIDKGSSLKEIISAILEEHLKFFKRQQKMPDHFFHFFEHSFDKETLMAYCHFANIPFDEQWSLDVLSIFDMKSMYDHDQEIIQFYKEEVEAKFNDYPEIKTKLLAFSNC